MKGLRSRIMRSNECIRHLWGRSGVVTKEKEDTPRDWRPAAKPVKLYWLEFDEPLPAKDEFGHDSHVAGWKGIWIPRNLLELI
jgi:hypothetical protein